jgi:hypothetical protein
MVMPGHGTHPVCSAARHANTPACSRADKGPCPQEIPDSGGVIHAYRARPGNGHVRGSGVPDIRRPASRRHSARQRTRAAMCAGERLSRETFHTRVCPSQLLVTRRVPSGLKATALTTSVWPVSTARCASSKGITRLRRKRSPVPSSPRLYAWLRYTAACIASPCNHACRPCSM